jgi:hypothetical protein
MSQIIRVTVLFNLSATTNIKPFSKILSRNLPPKLTTMPSGGINLFIRRPTRPKQIPQAYLVRNPTFGDILISQIICDAQYQAYCQAYHEADDTTVYSTFTTIERDVSGHAVNKSIIVTIAVYNIYPAGAP